MHKFKNFTIMKENTKNTDLSCNDSNTMFNSGMDQRLLLAGMIAAGIAVNVGTNGFTLPNPLKDIAEFSLMLADELIEQNNKVEEKI